MESKMKPLKTVQRLLTLLCLCTADEGTSKWKKTVYIIITCILISTQVFVCVESVAFLFNFTPKDFEHFLFAAAITLSRLSMLYIIIIAIVSWKEIPTIFSSLSEIYDASKIINMIYFCIIEFELVADSRRTGGVHQFFRTFLDRNGFSLTK